NVFGLTHVTEHLVGQVDQVRAMPPPGLGDLVVGLRLAHVFTTIFVGEKLQGAVCNFPISRSVLEEKNADQEATMTIVITGATGNVGRPLASLLAAAGARVRAVTRTPKTAGFPDGVEAVSSIIDALPGASAVFLNSRALG